MHCSQTAKLVRGKKKSVGGKMRYLFIVKNMSVFKTILKQLLFFFYAPVVERGGIGQADFLERKCQTQKISMQVFSPRTAEVVEVFLRDESTQKSNSNEHLCQPRRWEQGSQCNRTAPVLLQQDHPAAGTKLAWLPLNTFPQNLAS